MIEPSQPITLDTCILKEFRLLVRRVWETDQQVLSRLHAPFGNHTLEISLLDAIDQQKDLPEMLIAISSIKDEEWLSISTDFKNMLVYAALTVYEKWLKRVVVDQGTVAEITAQNLAFAALRASTYKGLNIVFKDDDLAVGHASTALPLPQYFVPLEDSAVESGWNIVIWSLSVAVRQYLSYAFQYSRKKISSGFHTQLQNDFSKRVPDEISTLAENVRSDLKLVVEAFGAPLVYFVDPVKDQAAYPLLMLYRERIKQEFNVDVVEWKFQDESFVRETGFINDIIRKVFQVEEVFSVKGEVDQQRKQDCADIILFTVNDNETNAVHEFFSEANLKHIEGIPYWDLGVSGGARVLHAVTDMGDHGAAQAARHAIQYLNPVLLVGVGIAWGANPNEMSIGDILVAKELVDIAHKKLTIKGDKPRGKINNLDDKVWRNIKAAHVEWKRLTLPPKNVSLSKGVNFK